MSLLELKRRPQKLIRVNVNKEAKEDVIGLTLNYYDGGLILIRHVDPDEGLYTETDLKAGLILLTVNETDVKGLSTVDVMEIFTEAEGEIFVLAEDIGLSIASITKETLNSKVGIGLKDRGGKIFISNIAPDGMFSDTDISIGQQLISVNGTSCLGLMKNQAIVLFKELEGLTVMTKDLGIISATVQKSSPDCKVGIGLRAIKGSIIVSSVSEEGLFAGTSIVPGLKLLTVNKTEVSGLTRTDAITPFKDAEKSITVTAENVGYINVNVVKPSIESSVGIGLKEVRGHIMISSISKDGLFNGTELMTGLRLVCVNNTLCFGITKNEAINLFKEAEGPVTVLAERVGVITAEVRKDSVDTKVGIGLKSVDGRIVISSISDEGLFGDSDLSIGLRLVSVNKHLCMNMSKNEAIKLFKEAEGKITVMAEEIGMITATVVKETADTKVGIGLKEKGDDIVISCIYDTGLFVKTDLRDDLRLVSVNDTKVKGMSRDEAIKLFRDAEGPLTVMAEDVSERSFLA